MTNDPHHHAGTSGSKQNTTPPKLPGQVVLVMQGGGALGAFQAGVYQGMHEAGIEPDWVVGTSIGAINGAIIAGNTRQDRLLRLQEFWQMVSRSALPPWWGGTFDAAHTFANMQAIFNGVPGFFTPNREMWFDPAQRGYFYSTEPLRETLSTLVNCSLITKGKPRLSLGAVNVRTGTMRYFDSRVELIRIEHIMASGALPPAFPAVVIDGEAYWDGGIYSNTPIEVVMADNPRRNSLIITAELWQKEGAIPDSIEAALGRHKDIQYSSRVESHTTHQAQLHHLRHVVRKLGELLPPDVRDDLNTQELLAWGCRSVMHVLHLRAPALARENHAKDIDFTPDGVAKRWQAGRELALRRIHDAPWNGCFDPALGIVMHR